MSKISPVYVLSGRANNFEKEYSHLLTIDFFSSDSHSSSPFNTKTIIAKDCVNGTYMPKGLIQETATNYTEINRVFLSHGHRHMLDPQMLNIPYDQSITIYDKTKVKILEKTSKP